MSEIFSDIISDRNIVATTYKSSEKVLLIIAPATGVRQTFYKYFAEYICKAGITVVTFDYLGVGDSLHQPLGMIKTNASEWGHKDLEATINYVKKKFPYAKITLLGHSIGGQLIGFAQGSTLVDKIILVGSQSGYWRFWKGLRKIRMFINWYFLFPAATRLIGYFPSKIISKMENLPPEATKEWAKWCRSRNYLFDFYREDQLYFSQINCSLLAISISDDLFAPKESVDWLTAKFPQADVKKMHLIPEQHNLKEIGHFGVFKKKSKETIWKILLNEIEN